MFSISVVISINERWTCITQHNIDIYTYFFFSLNTKHPLKEYYYYRTKSIDFTNKSDTN